MYLPRSDVGDSHDLVQGDLIAGLLRPKLAVNGALTLVESGNKLRKPPAPTEALREPDPNLRLVSRLERLGLALVLSNSCDNTGDYPLIFAPVRPYKFSEGATSDVERWLDISEAATGTASPRLFYLPGAPESGFDRSEALLSHMFTLGHDFVQRCLADGGAHVVCGLGEDGLRHLRWALGHFFSRDPREDDAWPSHDDLRLKRKWLESELARGTSRQEEYQRELDRIIAVLSASGLGQTRH